MHLKDIHLVFDIGKVFSELIISNFHFKVKKSEKILESS